MVSCLGTTLLLVGLFLWLYGLFLLYRQLDHDPGLLMSALAVALCTSGLAVSVTALAELERRMTDVAQFRLKDRMHGYAQLRAASTEIAILLGQMLALILLTLLCMPSVPLARLDLASLVSAFRPLMVQRLLQKGCKIHTGARVVSVEGDTVQYEQDGSLHTITGVDTVVSAVGTRPEKGLAAGLKALGIPTWVIGDAAGSGTILAATREGWETAQRLP